MAALTGVSAVGAVHNLAGANVTIALTGVSATGTTGQIQANKKPGEGLVLRLPRVQLAMTGLTGTTSGLAFTLPLVKFALVGDVPQIGTLTILQPTPQLVLTGLVGAVGTLALKLPTPKLRLGQDGGVALRLPVPQLALAGTSGGVGDLRLLTKAPVLSLVGDTPVIGALSLALPAQQIAMTGVAGAAGRLGILMRSLTLAMQGTTGVVGTLVINVPVVRFSANAYWEATGVLQLTLPAMHLTLTGGAPQTRTAGGSAPVGNTNTLVMHTERQALSQYTNYPFNSFARFAGVYIGASDAGVFALTGDTDAGVLIDAAARTGITDFGTSHIKRVDRIYMGCRANGALVLRVITDEGAVRDYRVPQPQPQFNNELHGTHVRMGRGVEARYWQFEMRNQNGADFSIDIVEMKPTKLRRRIGGRDA